MILVTGGTGLVGSRLLFDLTSRGEKVRAIKREGSNLDSVRRVFSYYSKNPGDPFYNIEWVDADILNIDSLLEAMQNISHVYHAAAIYCTWIAIVGRNRRKLAALCRVATVTCALIIIITCYSRMDRPDLWIAAVRRA